MARRTRASVLGQFRGRVGPVVFSSYMDIETVSIRPAKGKRRKKQTGLQVEQTLVFSNVNYLLGSIRPLIKLSFQSSKNKIELPFSAAVSEVMLNAIVDHEDRRYIDFSLIKLSKSSHRTEQLWEPVIKAEAGRKITVSWELNSFSKKCTRLDDLVKIVFCSKQDPRFRQLPRPTQRKDLSITFNSAHKTSGHEIFLYAVVISADGKLVAESEYLGSVIVVD